MRQLAPVQLLHLARPVLHVAVFPGRRGAQRVRRARHDIAALYQKASSGAGCASPCTRLSASPSRSLLPVLASKLGRKNTHSLCLLCGALGLISVAIIHDKYFCF